MCIRDSFQPGADPLDKKLVAEMRGKKIPQIGVIDISIMEEGQSRWLAFQDGQLDYLNIPQEYTPKALVGDKLRPCFARAKAVQKITERENQTEQPVVEFRPHGEPECALALPLFSQDETNAGFAHAA